MKAALLSAAAAVLMLAGCGVRPTNPQCDSACQAFNACTVDQRPVNYDCPEYCADIQSGITEGVACTQQFNDYFACLNQNRAQICDKTFEGCATQTAAFDDCIVTFCADEANAGSTFCLEGEQAFYSF